MSEKMTRPYGLWDSPITPASLAQGLGLSDLAWDQDGTLVWLESRPDRSALVVQPPDGQAPHDLNGLFSVQGGVGYGGGGFTLGHRKVYFVEASAGRIYCQPLHDCPAEPLTPGFGGTAAPALSPDGRWLLFIRTYEDRDSLEIVDAEGKFWPQKLVWGDDFYMQPVWHPGGQLIAWIRWNRPNMPWDGTELFLGPLSLDPGGLPTLIDAMRVAGDAHTAIFQPEFSPDGRYLAFVSDASGWGQIYLYDLEKAETRQLTRAAAEHGTPAWIQGLRRYGFSPDGRRLFALRSQAGFVSLWQIEVETGEEQRVPLDEGYTSLDQIRISPAAGQGQEVQIGLIASGGARPSQLITCLPSGRTRIWRRTASQEVPARMYSRPEVLQWPGLDGGTVHGLFYPPQNPSFEGAGSPPLIVSVHGGPTGQATSHFNGENQFFATRGFAVLDVNFRGSTGYGRPYQDALRGNWGIYDVQDSVSGARFLANAGRVDQGRIVILGGSSGGFAVLKALVDYPGFFKAGICLYGISNQFTAASDTHKFELHYTDNLLGPLPEAAEVYRERSPLFQIDKIQDPVALFHGEEDRVVPRRQSDEVAEALRRRGIPHLYHVYPDEGHGFRKPETIEHFYHTVEAFLRQYVIFN